LDSDLNLHPNLAIFRQADNGVVIRMALFALVLGVEDSVHKTSAPVKWFTDTRTTTTT
jgi:aspartate carbamoyltransferase catalytic subunit